MAQIPANQKLWVMYVAQAKAKYHTWPSPTAAEWVHNHYTQAGGKFVSSEREVDDKFRDNRYSKNAGEKGSKNQKALIQERKEKAEEAKKNSKNKKKSKER
jgi:tRNA G26 N,N-dimethylase Trm1